MAVKLYRKFVFTALLIIAIAIIAYFCKIKFVMTVTCHSEKSRFSYLVQKLFIKIAWGVCVTKIQISLKTGTLNFR